VHHIPSCKQYLCYQSQSVTGEGLSLRIIIRQEDKQFVEQVEHCRLKSWLNKLSISQTELPYPAGFLVQSVSD